MKALIYEAPQTMRLGEQPPPVPASDEVILAVAAVGICGSDMHAFLGHDERRPPPLILGHEAAGTLTDGAQVIVNPLVVCDECDYCKSGRSNLCRRRQIISMPPRPGAFAETLAIPQKNLLSLPPQLSLQQGALAEPLVCGHHAAARAVKHSGCPLAECSVAVLGGGAIGLAAALSLAARGAKPVHIAEANLRRHPILQQAGDFCVMTPDKMLAVADIVIDTVGSADSRSQASALAAAAGVVVHIGLGDATGGFDMRRLTLQEIVLSGSYAYTMDEFVETVAWMAAGKLGPLDWFETRPLTAGAQAFAELLAGQVAAPKIVLLP